MDYRKSDLVSDLVADGMAKSKDEAKASINYIFDKIIEEVANGSTVSIPGVMVLKPKTNPAKEGTVAGKPYSSPERKTVVIKALTAFKDTLNKA